MTSKIGRSVAPKIEVGQSASRLDNGLRGRFSSSCGRTQRPGGRASGEDLFIHLISFNVGQP
jgi:hypothetical protein